MMGHIVVLISACAVSVVLGMLLMALCNASGNAERDAEWREWETKYQAHVVKLQKRILELETLLADDAADVFAKPPDEDDGCDSEADRMRAWFAEHGHD